MTPEKPRRVRVLCPRCGWQGRRAEPWRNWYRNREVPTCPDCGHHPVLYGRPRHVPVTVEAQVEEPGGNSGL